MTYNEAFLIAFMVYCISNLISCFFYFKWLGDEETINKLGLGEFYEQINETTVHRMANGHAFLLVVSTIFLIYGDLVI